MLGGYTSATIEKHNKSCSTAEQRRTLTRNDPAMDTSGNGGADIVLAKIGFTSAFLALIALTSEAAPVFAGEGAHFTSTPGYNALAHRRVTQAHSQAKLIGNESATSHHRDARTSSAGQNGTPRGRQIAQASRIIPAQSAPARNRSGYGFQELPPTGTGSLDINITDLQRGTPMQYQTEDPVPAWVLQHGKELGITRETAERLHMTEDQMRQVGIGPSR